MIILVTGNGRCGSSLCMQMLNAAGIPCAGKHPFYEDERSSVSKFDPDWLLTQEGKAVKLLGVHHLKVKPAEYKVIYLHRNPSAQALSQNKLQETVIGGKAESYEAMKWQVKKSNKACLKAAEKLGPVLKLRFEAFIEQPVWAIAHICGFLGLKPGKVGQGMLDCVVSRGVECLPDMSLEANNQ